MQVGSTDLFQFTLCCLPLVWIMEVFDLEGGDDLVGYLPSIGDLVDPLTDKIWFIMDIMWKIS